MEIKELVEKGVYKKDTAEEFDTVAITLNAGLAYQSCSCHFS